MPAEIRLFTIEEANALIPTMELLMERVQRCGLALRAEIESAAEEMGCGFEDMELSTLLEGHPSVGELAAELEHQVGEIERRGAQFKGFELGLVDFPAELDGEVVLLCWQFGEKEISHWHGLEDGFDGRQPLPVAVPRTLVQ